MHANGIAAAEPTYLKTEACVVSTTELVMLFMVVLCDEAHAWSVIYVAFPWENG